MANEDVHDRLDVSATIVTDNPVFTILNGLDEPIPIRALLNRLIDLGGTPAFTIGALAIGAAAHDATRRSS